MTALSAQLASLPTVRNQTDERTRALGQLKSQLGARLFLGDADPDRFAESARRKSVSTGLDLLDQKLARGGFPCGELSFLVGELGLGSTCLWIESARLQTTIEQKRVCWVNQSGARLNPIALMQRGVCLDKVFFVSAPKDMRQRNWLLRELLESQLFSLIAVDLGDERLPVREARSWLTHVRRSGVAVIGCFRLPSAQSLGPLRELAHVIIEFHSSGLNLVRSVHRSTPVFIERSPFHEFEQLLPSNPDFSHRLEHASSRAMG